MQDDDSLSRLLTNVRLLAGLDRGELVELLGIMEKNVFAKGDDIFLEGDASSSVYLVISGSVEVYRTTNGRRIMLAKLGPGESFGEMSLLHLTERTASVRALEPCVTLKFPKERIQRIPQVAFKIYRNVAQILARRLQTSNDVVLLHMNATSNETEARNAPAPGGHTVTRSH